LDLYFLMTKLSSKCEKESVVEAFATQSASVFCQIRILGELEGGGKKGNYPGLYGAVFRGDGVGTFPDYLTEVERVGVAFGVYQEDL